MMAMEPDSRERNEDDNSREPRYTWNQVSHEARHAGILGALRVALPPTLATYDDELGFRLLLDDSAPSTGWMSQTTAGSRALPGSMSGAQRSYVEHITGLMRAYDWSVRREIAWVAQRLETALNLAPGSVDEAVRLAIACHDIGKLARDWQAWAHGWQTLLVKRYGAQYAVQPGRAFLAKTDRAPYARDERSLQAELRVKRPNHSCVGVVVGGQLVARHLLERNVNRNVDRSGAFALAQAVWSAIARHHAPTARSYDRAGWDPSARAVISEALTVCGLPATSEKLAMLALDDVPASELPEHFLIAPSFERDARDARDIDGNTPTLTTWLGFVLVRALRLCDQRAERDLS